MERPSEFVDFVIDILAPLGGVGARRMFGGHGLFRDGVMFGLIADDTLYLKADDRNRPDFEDAGMAPFTYARSDRRIALSYFEAPPDALEDPDEICDWARKAADAALRSGQRKQGRRA